MAQAAGESFAARSQNRGMTRGQPGLYLRSNAILLKKRKEPGYNQTKYSI